MPGRGTRHGSTATMSRAASSSRRAPRVSTSAPSTIDARAAKASSTHHAAASGRQEQRDESADLRQRVRLQRAVAPSSTRGGHPEQAAARERTQQRLRPGGRRGGSTATCGRERRSTRAPRALLPHRAGATVRKHRRGREQREERRRPRARPNRPRRPSACAAARRTATSPITSVRSPMRVRGEHAAGRVDHGAVAVAGDAKLRQARFDAAERRGRQVQLRRPAAGR